MSRRVLVVDDNHHNQELARMCLKQLVGFTVDTASSGTAARTVLEQDELPDVVLLDAMMPGLDGLTLVRLLRQPEHTRTLAVVLLTAKNLSDEVDLDQLGIRGALGKPFHPMTRATQFSKLLDWPDSSPR